MDSLLKYALEAHGGLSAWDKLQSLHANLSIGDALWNLKQLRAMGYLTTPFLYTYPGFEAQEFDPWYENGERWRVLQVTFPNGYAAHTRTQYSYFGEDFQNEVG